MNPMFLIDGYKLDHRRQYPAGTTHVYSNWTPRSSRVPDQKSIVFFGLQYFLACYATAAMNDWFSLDRVRVVDDYRKRLAGYLGPDNGIGTEHIEALHSLGYLPLEFRAMPEGALCPLRVPALTVENTHPDFAWLVNYIETVMSSVLWLPCTSATSAYRLRMYLNSMCQQTGGDPGFVQWQGHDFSMRGMGGVEAAALSGAGHLLSFTGSDTVPAIDFIEKYYPGDNGLIAGTVPATEHSVMSAGGSSQPEEAGTFDRLLSLYPKGVVSIVADTWSLWNVLDTVLPLLREKIMARDGKLVIRPDSGDPIKIVCGDPEALSGTPQNLGVIRMLAETFGTTTNEAGFLHLRPTIGCIYGDAITFDRAKAICDRMKQIGFASTNMVFGVGSYTYQYVTRDTYGFAMKATWARINGEGRDLFKKPVTDNGEKFSATGRLAVVQTSTGLQCIQQATPFQESESILVPTWRDGKFIRRQSFASIRKNLWP